VPPNQWRFGFTQTTLWRIDVNTFSGLPSLDTTENPSSPFQSIYRSGDGDDAEEGGARLRKHLPAH
jgi:hypothetical protein